MDKLRGEIEKKRKLMVWKNEKEKEKLKERERRIESRMGKMD